LISKLIKENFERLKSKKLNEKKEKKKSNYKSENHNWIKKQYQGTKLKEKTNKKLKKNQKNEG